VRRIHSRWTVYTCIPCSQSVHGAPTGCLQFANIGADFRFEVPEQSSVGLIGGGRGQWLVGTMASAEHEPIMESGGTAPSGV